MTKIQKNNKVEMLRFKGLSLNRDISHFMTTRHGGVSTGTYASLNPGEYSGDESGAVRENRAILSREVGLAADRIFAPFQTHEDKVEVLDLAFMALGKEARAERLRGVDALVTDLPNVCVAVATADCVPILLFAPDRRVVAAVHAGWRGTVLGIAGKAARLMVDQFGCDPERIQAGIGPSIGQEAFEVGDEVVEAFARTGVVMEGIARRNPLTGKAHVDLWEANRRQLLSVGLLPDQIEVCGICTYTHPDDYFSARRLGIKSGRILSGIFLAEG